ncbi:T9SS type A sorting domain-containing protein [Aurantibacillus circumpalustris]|uniref:T9SS type A sorting domain-containing protein n=1 Tax=Aurantibacillus circumpalustris TaxID=3036359 RepID=UPI00295AAEE6|nr:peptide-N-glycosidase F-related protein [Aurantibacillus circumpalustris]
MTRKLTRLANLKKIVLLLIFAEVYNFSALSNPGDTTWVTIFNQRKITQYGNYDTTAVFPTGLRYRKIRMHYILGRYGCPAGSQYCGSWDYTTQIHAKPVGKDTVEIARVITPYATDWLSLNKKHDYIVDITDYASALEGITDMRYNYSGYSWGFTLTLKIEFIEGVPPMDALSVQNIYDGYFPYGNSSNSIENYLTAKSFSYTTPTARTFVKNTVSGHGSDNTGCAEFCSKYYQLKINNTMISQKQLWRSDCGINEVYPQTGTWIYDRGNWCPGAVVWPIYHELTNITSANTTFTVDADMQPYIGSGSLGGYNFVSQLINYSAPNHSLDVSIEDIVSPTKDANYFRENPRCSNPVIKIKNVGTDSLKSIVFNYGLKGQTPLTHTWTGSLGYLEERQEVFPTSTVILSGTVSSVFEVSVVSVNGNTGDQNLFNNIYTSETTPVPIYPKDFIIKMYTNNDLNPNNGYSETSWMLTNETGSVIVKRDSLAKTTVYIDTVLNLPAGCYKLEINDTGCDGMSWWANTAGGTGSLRFDYTNANNSIATFPGDMGCNYVRYFRVLAPATPPVLTGVKTANINSNNIEVYPNPADNMAYIKFDLTKSQTLSYKIMDITGKIVFQIKTSKIAASYETIDVSHFSNGVYFISVELEDKSVLTKKLVIQK